MESRLRPAPAQLDNRLRCFALRLTSLLRDQARELVGADRIRLQSFLGYWDRKEETVLLEVATPRGNRRRDCRQVGGPTYGPALG